MEDLLQNKPLRDELKNTLQNIYGDIHFNAQLIAALNDFADHHNNWRSNFINPYHSAYVGAVDNFKDAIRKRDEDRKAKMDLALFALSLCGGSAMTAVLGKLTIERYLEEKALKVICVNNMEKTFNAMAMVKGSPVTQFLLGQTTDKIAAWAKGEVHSSIMQVATLGNQVLLDNPAQVKNALNSLYTKSESTARAAFRQLAKKEHTSRDSYNRQRILQDIINSPFCRSPKTPVWPDVKILRDKIELSFYLKLVLLSGYKHTFVPKGGSYDEPIKVLPSNKSFPPKYKNNGYSWTSVEFRDIGDNISKKINSLYASSGLASQPGNTSGPLVQDSWYYDGTDYQGVKRVEKIMNQLGDVGLII